LDSHVRIAGAVTANGIEDVIAVTLHIPNAHISIRIGGALSRGEVEAMVRSSIDRSFVPLLAKSRGSTNKNSWKHDVSHALGRFVIDITDEIYTEHTDGITPLNLNSLADGATRLRSSSEMTSRVALGADTG